MKSSKAKFFFTLCVITTLLFAGFHPVGVQAAAQTAVYTQTVTSGVYVSEVISTTDGKEHQYSLTLNDDGSAEMSTDSMDGKDPLLEVGTWHQSKKGNIVVDLSGTKDKKYKKALEVVFKLDGDQLVTVGYDKKLYGNDGFTLTLSDSTAAPTSNEAASPATVDSSKAVTGTAETSASEATTETTPSDESSAPADVLVFVSDILPSADTAGRQITLELGQDHSATMITDYMNNEDPVVEIGTWEQNAKSDTQLDVTLTGSDSKEYDKPVAIVFDIDRETQTLTTAEYDKSLYGEEGFSLTLSDNTGADAGSTESSPTETQTSMIAGTYNSNVLPAADTAGIVMTLSLWENGNAQMVSNYLNGKLPIVEIGTWTDNGDETVTFVISGTVDATKDDGSIKEYNKPSEMTFNVAIDELYSGNLSLYKLANEVMDNGSSDSSTGADNSAGSDASASDSATTSVIYVSGKLSTAPTPDMQVTLELVDDGSLVMTTDYADGGDPLVEIGTWEQDQKDGSITVTVTGTEEEDYVDPIVVVFTEDNGKLVATDYDKEIFGTDGLELELQAN